MMNGTDHDVMTASHPDDGDGLSRRRFLQASSAAATVSLLPAWLAEHADAAVPIGRRDGVIVLLTLDGGNDGLNTFVPIGDGTYYDMRPGLAIPAASTLPLSNSRGLNPRLPELKRLWDAGQVAVVDGVGRNDPTLSHFSSMTDLMSAMAPGRSSHTGWLGRYLDGMGSNPLTGISLGSRVPLVVAGHRRRASAVTERQDSVVYFDPSEATNLRQQRAVHQLGLHSRGYGSLVDELAASYAPAIDTAVQVRPLVEPVRTEPKVVTRFRLAARLINANLGVRVLSIVYNGFDTHSDQAGNHGILMDELNAGLAAFYSTLSPSFADRTLLVGTSEFGRRVKTNGSGGTDHGAANSLFLIGSRINGGFHGSQPSLRRLDRNGNTIATLDFRHLYSNVLTRWLNADSAELIGRDYGDLGIFEKPGTTTPTTKPARAMAVAGASPSERVVSGPPVVERRGQIARLYLAYFLRDPDESGYEHWVSLRRSGASLSDISEQFATSSEFTERYGQLSNPAFVDLVYQNVLGRRPDAGGRAHWIRVLSGGGSRGDVMVGFSESSEFISSTSARIRRNERIGRVGRLYRAYFGRAPDNRGLDYWLNTGLPAAEISGQFAASTEFKNRYGSVDDGRFIDLMYRNVLGRAADTAGRRHWLGELHRGRARGAIMLGVSDSPEFARRVAALEP